MPLCITYTPDIKRKTEFTSAIESTGVRVLSLQQKLTFDPRLISQALEIVRHENINVLQSHGYKSHVLCAALHWRTGLPWIAFVHGWTTENMKIRLYHGIEKALIPFATRVVTVSESIRQRLLLTPRHKIRVIPNAVDPAEVEMGDPGLDIRACLGIPPDAPVAGVVGRLSPEKGQSFFLRALAAARARIPELVGILVGDGQDRRALETEASGLGLKGSLHFTGHVSSMAAYYRAMDLVVMPSLSEGMPNVALEAMLFGRALVATRVGGIPEVVADGVTGRLVDPRDPGGMAGAVCALLEDRELLRRMGQAGHQRVLEEFSPARRTRLITDMYNEVVQERRERIRPKGIKERQEWH